MSSHLEQKAFPAQATALPLAIGDLGRRSAHFGRRGKAMIAVSCRSN